MLDARRSLRRLIWANIGEVAQLDVGNPDIEVLVALDDPLRRSPHAGFGRNQSNTCTV